MKNGHMIIVDTYYKKQSEKPILGNDPSMLYNRGNLAVNAMYNWLFLRGLLKKCSFEFREYDDCVHFAMDIRRLARYRKKMLASRVEDADIAVDMIFAVNSSPCRYSGLRQPGGNMITYRSNSGCVGRSWECEFIQHLNTWTADDIHQIFASKGPREAARALFDYISAKNCIRSCSRYSLKDLWCRC